MHKYCGNFYLFIFLAFLPSVREGQYILTVNKLRERGQDWESATVHTVRNNEIVIKIN